jgi:hypothetical protein
VAINAKEAVTIAKTYMADIYGKDIQGLNVEEIELDPDMNQWHVTMGYWEFLPVPPNLNALAELTNRKVRRAYKELVIHDNSGQVLSMKIRVVPSPERS